MSEIDSGNDVSEQADDGVESPRRVRTRPEPRARRSKGRNWGLIAAAVLVLAVAGFLVFKAVGPKSAKTTYVTKSVTTGTLTVAVSANGSVVSANSSAVDPGVSGTVADAQRFARHPRRQGRHAVHHRQHRLGRERGTGQGLVPECAVVDGQGQAEHDAGEREQEHERARRPRGAYQQAKSSREKAEANEIQAQLDLNTALAGGDPSKIEIAQENYDAAVYSTQAARSAEKTAKRNYDAAIEIAQQGYDAAVKSYNAAVTGQQSAYLGYQNAKENANKRTVLAPIDGYVTTLTVRNGDQLGSSSNSGSSSSGGGATASTSNTG